MAVRPRRPVAAFCVVPLLLMHARISEAGLIRQQLLVLHMFTARLRCRVKELTLYILETSRACRGATIILDALRYCLTRISRRLLTA